ncbi:MAG: hypothetical protein IJ181_10030 [Acidaminococcaceae bacterium]|nr:hypothetical protein [Acidaminococcaceae bacterium]
MRLLLQGLRLLSFSLFLPVELKRLLFSLVRPFLVELHASIVPVVSLAFPVVIPN